MRSDRAGFVRRWGVYVHRQPRRSPWLSLGVHLDWHTPTLDLYLLAWVVQIGRNVWQPTGRFHYGDGGVGTGHTDQCMCYEDGLRVVAEWEAVSTARAGAAVR
jgi:hypothetical protein